MRITNAELQYTDLRYADLNDANLTNANLTNSYLGEEWFHWTEWGPQTSAVLTGSDLTNAILTDAILNYVSATNLVQCPVLLQLMIGIVLIIISFFT